MNEKNMNKGITIEDLKGGADEIKISATANEQNSIEPKDIEIREVQISEIAPITHEPTPGEKNTNEVFDLFDKREKELAKQSIDIRKDLAEKQLESHIVNDEDGDEDKLNLSIESSTHSVSNKKPDIKLDEEDFADIEEDTDDVDLELHDEEDDEDASIDEVQKALKDKIKSVSKKVDISSFSINKKPVSLTNALTATEKERYVVDWIMSASKTMASMKQYKGNEIEKIIERQGDATFAGQKRIFSSLYHHLVGENSTNFESWLKTFYFYDLEDLWFLAYMACFRDANYLPYKCTNEKCNNVWISDVIPMEEMVEYKSDKIKEEMQNILKSGKVKSEEVPVELVPITDKLVFGIKDPSLFDIIFQYGTLEDKFTNKYSDILSLVSFIDGIYMINEENKTLDPIEFKQYENNLTKTIKSKIKICYKFIDTLDTDEYQDLTNIIRAVEERHQNVSYVIPKATCPKCGAVLPKEELSSKLLLFTRYQLTGDKLG